MIQAEMEVSSSGKDTDVIVRVCDVFPDGRAMLVRLPSGVRYRTAAAAAAAAAAALSLSLL